MAVNKVIYGGNTLVDLTGDTVTAADLADGVKATGADGKPIVGLMKKVTIDSLLSDTSTNPVQNNVIKAALDKKMAKTDKIYEANLAWGGRNIADGYSPIDAAMVSELGANHLMFGKVEGFTIEYSEDAGATWHEYPVSGTKNRLFSTGNYYFYAGGEKSRQPSVNDMLRVTIDPDAFGVYTALKKFIIVISTGGARGCYCTIDASLESSPNTFEVFTDRAPLSGWSGYNVINTSPIETYSNQPTRQYGIIRFTFGCTTVPTNPNYKGLALFQIMGFGGAGWNSPSNMAKHGHLYDFNAWQQAIFPDSVTATNFIGKVNGFDVKASVPANAKFTDTVYEHPSTHPASMITGLADVAKSGSYNDLADKPTIPASITIDSELSATSTNPVQNKVITEAIANIGGGSGNYLPLTGGTVTGGITASNFQTGTGAANYFQCRKFRGEGDANSYYHAIDFGYSGHDSVDFYEYDPSWNFYKCLTGTKSGAVLVGNINGNGWNGGARLTGAPTAPTAAVGTNTTQIATTAFVHSAIPTNLSSFINDAGYLTQHQSLDGYVKSVNGTKPDSNGNVTIPISGGSPDSGVSLSAQNVWTAQQTFEVALLELEKYTTTHDVGTSIVLTKSTAWYIATGNFTLDLTTMSHLISNGQSQIITVYIQSSADYSLTIKGAGTLKYIGAASDLAITSAGLLLNILMMSDSINGITSIVQASKLS